MDAKDWYARRLGAPRPALPATPPISQQLPQPGAPQYGSLAPAQEDSYAPAGATHLRSDRGGCPECGSTNYHAFQGAKPRCFSCGYPMMQSGSGVGAEGVVTGPPQAAMQVNVGGNWNPTGFAKGVGIIGRDPSVPN